MIPTVRRVGGLRFEFDADDYAEAFRTFHANGCHRGRLLSRFLQMLLTNTYFGVSDHHDYIIARRPIRVGVSLSIAAQV